jgi:hypothetical protein
MADEAFALSPISARAAQPREEDYDAISEAFMETSRGRWFLGEYAKRNRNADTRMVLDAVERIEQSLAAQKQPEPEPVPDTRLADALIAIKAALNEAKAAAAAAVDSLALEQHLAPVRKGARVIREISWRWREIGADGRICDLLDSQVSAIEASCGQISSLDPHTALAAAFDLIGGSIAAFDDGDDARAEAGMEVAAAAFAAPSPASSSEMPAAAMEPAQTSPDDAEAAAGTQALSVQASSVGAFSVETSSVEAVSAQALPAQTAPAEEAVAPAQAITEANVEAAADVAQAATVTVQATDAIQATDMASAAPEVVAEAAEMTAEAADAHDEAVLDMIAAEMSAYDPSDEDGDADPDGFEMRLANPPAAEAATIASTSEETSQETSGETSVAPEIVPAIESPAAASPQPALEPEPSIGSTLIANGFLRKPAVSASDPLAAIRRLSQIEKIALFS